MPNNKLCPYFKEPCKQRLCMAYADRINHLDGREYWQQCNIMPNMTVPQEES